MPKCRPAKREAERWSILSQFMRMNKAQEARAMQGQGRAGRGWHTKTKEDLVDQLDERRDLRRGFGVETHHGISGGLPTCNSRARMRTACSNIQCAATALTPQPVQKPPDTRRQSKSSKCLDITSRAPGFCRQSTARARPAVREEGRGPAHAEGGRFIF